MREHLVSISDTREGEKVPGHAAGIEPGAWSLSISLRGRRHTALPHRVPSSYGMVMALMACQLFWKKDISDACGSAPADVAVIRRCPGTYPLHVSFYRY
jgi:hypothetical protein